MNEWIDVWHYSPAEKYKFKPCYILTQTPETIRLSTSCVRAAMSQLEGSSMINIMLQPLGKNKNSF